MLKYVEITSDNLDFATEMQMQIFPIESAYIFYKQIIDRNNEYEKSYLVYDKENLIGVTGLYCCEDINLTNTIWLGWMGVFKEYRRMGYGKEILLDTIEMAKNLAKKYPIKYLRLYTSERDNKDSLFLYDKVMDLKEYYYNENDINYDNTCVVYSKNLTEEKIKKWDNDFIDIKRYVKEEQESNQIFKNKMKNKRRAL